MESILPAIKDTIDNRISKEGIKKTREFYKDMKPNNATNEIVNYWVEEILNYIDEVEYII